jgi:transcriptional regulator with XRE-family HTH domain
VPKDLDRDAVCAEVVRLLSEERQKKGFSMNNLAAKAGLSQSLISTLESNPWNPTLDTLLRIAGVLDVRLGDILLQAEKSVRTPRPSK